MAKEDLLKKLYWEQPKNSRPRTTRTQTQLTKPKAASTGTARSTTVTRQTDTATFSNPTPTVTLPAIQKPSQTVNTPVNRRTVNTRQTDSAASIRQAADAPKPAATTQTTQTLPKPSQTVQTTLPAANRRTQNIRQTDTATSAVPVSTTPTIQKPSQTTSSPVSRRTTNIRQTDTATSAVPVKPTAGVNELGVSSYGAAQRGIEAYRADKAEKIAKENDATWWEDALASMNNNPDSTLPMSNYVLAVNAYREDTSYREPDSRWSEEQWNNFGLLYLENKNIAYQYAEMINNELNIQERVLAEQALAKKAEENGALYSAGALLTSQLGLVDYLDYMAEKEARGTITQRAEILPYEASTIIQNAVQEDIQENYGDGAADLYGGTMNVGKSLLAAYSGGSANAALATYGAACSNAIRDAKARGVSDDNAIMYAQAVALLETLPEVFSVDHLLNLKSPKSVQDAMANMFTQGGVDALGTSSLDLLTLLAEELILGDFSQMDMLTKKYQQEGCSYETARRYAWSDIAENLLVNAMSSFASGMAKGAVENVRKVGADYFNQEAEQATEKPVENSFDNDIIESRKTQDQTKDTAGKKGGRYGDVYVRGEGAIYEVHHMPAKSVTGLSRNNGPAIKMEKEDHEATASWGRKSTACDYRAKQKELIDSGLFLEAVQMDIDDIHKNFGNKYDDAIEQMMDYVLELLKEERK